MSFYNVNETVKEGIELIRQGFKVLSSGPLEYYLEKLVVHSDALLTKFAPFKIGERVQLKKGIPVTDGWAGSKQDLVENAWATIHSVDYYDDHFSFHVVLDVESYIYDGERKFVENKHTFCLHEKWLKKPIVDAGE